MAAPSVAPTIDRKPSIETEPRTLDIQQINFAREAALYVMSTKTIEEAFKIFTEGLEPVVSPGPSVQSQNEAISVATVGDDPGEEEEEEEEEDEEEEDEYTVYVTSDNKRQLGVEELRDVYTAPF